MKPELGFEMEFPGQLEESEPDCKSEDPVNQQPDEARPESNGSDIMGSCYVPRFRPCEPNGFIVYRRNKRLKTGGNENEGSVGASDKLQGCLGIWSIAAGTENLNGRVLVSGRKEGNLDGGEAVNAGRLEGDLGLSGVKGGDSKMVEIEVKLEPPVLLVKSDASRRFTRSTLKMKSDNLERENGNSGELRDTVVLEAERLGNGDVSTLVTPTMTTEMKTTNKFLIKLLPTTVRELFETRLLEGYPVLYNGGKRGFPLRGTIKESGILCSCSLCKGSRVIPPCQFEIHACKSYRRASQYICLENGKSLLDVVKECRKASLKTLEETIQNFIGPLPVKESIVCQSCKGSFLATSPGKMDQLCDFCMCITSSEADATSAESRHLEPLPGLTLPDTGEMHNIPQRKGYRGRKERKHLELKSNGTSPGRSSLRISSRNKSQWTISEKSSRSASGSSLVNLSESNSVLNATGSGSLHSSMKNKSRKKILKKSSNFPPVSKSLKSASSSLSAQKSSWKITKKDQTMHKIVFEDGGLPDGTEVAYYSHGKKLRDGYKIGSGILCRCCNILISPSQFEAHAGWASRKKPYMYIYTSNGVSLHEFAVSLLKGRKYSAKDSDDLCIICADGGKLVLCDGCPRAFHKECASLSSIPPGKWYCTYCQNMFQRERFVEHNANAVAAGRVSGVDPIEQIANRCIRIVRNPGELEVIACVICRGYDYSKSGFGPRTVILCDQCEKEYHVGCLKKCKIADLKELPKGKWFCSLGCKRIYAALQNVVSSGAEKLSDSSLGVIRKKHKENGLDSDTNLDVRWRLLNAKVSSCETRVLLSQAVAIFHECFDPIVDMETGRDFIPSMVYGRNVRGQDFSGMYCAMLTVNSSVVSAGILRIFGQDIAELPLVATRMGNQRKGYFQILYSCIEKLLAFLNVRTFVLPAADEAKSIWTEKFGFQKIPQEQLDNYRQTCWQMVSFKGTSMLGKAVPKCRIITQEEAEPDVPLQ
ncbi:Acyl-CoA N-acyltransferase with RING/FYVE/PHD-type zinc finger domain [Forsythia ovata]|uniref:Acyl-CoA N-acyltransferase with RING/FYVE/PHD-type zinc finger domain n=1 Tax=Forsythia ovata TaxID=205694 RepID=A0ABD1T8Y1_9LAMI